LQPVRLPQVTPDQVGGNRVLFDRLRHQRGAMFGMDARIALMIFGLMAVVTGYAGYSRISSAREAKLAREVQAIDQALTQYQSDMGTFFPFTITDSDGATDMEALWDKTRIKAGFATNWNGPYTHIESRKHSGFGTWGLVYGQADRTDFCTLDTACYVWIRLTDVPASQWEAVNRVVDEGYGNAPEAPDQRISQGRVQADGEQDPRQLFFRSVMRKGL
ncbi:MAG: hypothetical protein WAX89_08430, partial [Alphaproteobacteria bacterium]